MSRDPNAWRNVPMPAVFEADFDGWIKSLSKKARAAEPVMRWQDLGPYSHCAYGLHEHLASTYCFLVSKKKGPTELPDNCTPEGFYLEAVATRRRQVGLDAPPPLVKTSKKAAPTAPVEVTPFVPTAFERLSPFSQFIYRRMADRVAVAAGFTTATSRASTLDDGLGDDLSADDDGLGVDDGLGGRDTPDDLDDGLGGAVAASRWLIYHAESESYVEVKDEFDRYDLFNNATEDLLDVTGVARHEEAFRHQVRDDGLGGELGDGL